LVCFLLVGAIQIQEAIWKAESGKPTDPAVVDQLRAYVHVHDGDVIHTPDSPPTVSVVVKNTGKTPALDFTWRAVFVLADVNGGDQIAPDPNAIPTKGVLAPDGIASYRYTFPSWDKKFDEMLRTGTALFFAVGEMCYKDKFGNDRFTNYRLISGGRFGTSSGISPGKWGAAPGDNESN
jgi:hypothetical protein